MKYNTQQDRLWKNVSMALTEDTLGAFGCLVTSLANILQIIMHLKRSFTPKDLNDIIIKEEAYDWYSNELPEKASCLDWKKFKDAFKESLIIRNFVDKSEYVDCKDYYYIARIKFKDIHTDYEYNTGHYVNVISKTENYWTVFDTYYGGLHLIKDIDFLHEVEFTGG